MKDKILHTFKEIFGDEGDIRCYFAPGRVNMIGEHTDYNGGYVFPCALTIGTYAAVRKREDTRLRFYSMNFDQVGILEEELNELALPTASQWINYPKGVIWALKQKGYVVDKGMDIMIYGNIPDAAGLSSSAALEVVTGYFLNDLFKFGLSNKELAIIAQYAENHYNGVNCGIMDQFASAMGKKDCAIFLNTRNLSFEYIPLKLEQAKIIIAFSHSKRKLEHSQYNERRGECEKALEELQTVVNIHSLAELNEEQFETYKVAIKDPIRMKRAKHAVYENQRTIKAVKALKQDDLERFGQLMNESHISLRDDYEVTGINLDTLVENAWKVEGVIGSRMTGAGFGGCTVSVVKESAVDTFIKQVGDAYEKKIGYKADFYVVEAGDGPCRI